MKPLDDSKPQQADGYRRPKGMKIQHFFLIVGICISGGITGQASVVAYYRMEGTSGIEIGGTITDSSGNGRDITVGSATVPDKYVNIVANDPSTIPQTGAANTTALNIDSKGATAGGTLSLTAASNSAWNHFFEKQAFTIEGWISPSDYLFGQSIDIATRGNIYATGWQLQLDNVSSTSETLSFRSAGVFVAALTVTGLTNGTMDYFSVIGQANGDLDFSYAGQTATVLAAAYTAATDTTSPISFFQGQKIGNFQIDEVRFSDTALASSQLLNTAPEPAPIALFGLGTLAMAVVFRNRRAMRGNMISH